MNTTPRPKLPPQAGLGVSKPSLVNLRGLTDAFIDLSRAAEKLYAFALIAALQLDTLGKYWVTVISLGAPEDGNALVVEPFLEAFITVALVRSRRIDTGGVQRAYGAVTLIDICREARE